MTLEQRIARLEDIEAIKDLCARYARLVNKGDGRAVGALYTEDGFFQAGVAEVRGRANLQDFLARALTPNKSTPCISNHQITLNGDSARGTCTMHTPWYRDEAPGFCGEYTDEYRKVDGKWYFVRRDFEFHQGRPADS